MRVSEVYGKGVRGNVRVKEVISYTQELSSYFSDNLRHSESHMHAMPEMRNGHDSIVPAGSM